MKLIFAFLVGFALVIGGSDELFAVDANLSWVDMSGVDPAVNDQEQGFRVERKLNAGSYAVLTTVGPNVVVATDTTLVQALATNTYCYRVQAFNSIGSSAYSNEACKVVPGIPLTIPAPASNLTVK
jgi:trimeric autotransporter adhesin